MCVTAKMSINNAGHFGQSSWLTLHIEKIALVVTKIKIQGQKAPFSSSGERVRKVLTCSDEVGNSICKEARLMRHQKGNPKKKGNEEGFVESQTMGEMENTSDLLDGTWKDLK